MKADERRMRGGVDGQIAHVARIGITLSSMSPLL